MHTPKTLFIEQGAREFPITQKFLQAFPDIAVVDIESAEQLSKMCVAEPKKCVFLCINHGEFVKKFPTLPGVVAAPDSFVYHNYNCYMKCQYCFLQGYFQHSVPTIFVNDGKMYSQLKEHIARNRNAGNRLYYHFGEMGDALYFEAKTGVLKNTHDIAKQNSDAKFEFRTKTSFSGYAHAPENIIMSWTLAPQIYIDKYETGTSSLLFRLQAAAKAKENGYTISFHLDPIVAGEDWQQQYKQLIETLFKYIAPDLISKISLGVLRFNRKLKDVIAEQYPQSDILSNEFYEGVDGKYRYFKKNRVEIYKTIANEIKRYTVTNKAYLCMETPVVWKAVGLPRH